MQLVYLVFFNLMLLLSTSLFGDALDCQLFNSNQHKVAYTITVDGSGKGNFTTVQSAINSIPKGNTRWIRIMISQGVYKEKVEIPVEKPCIFLQGAGRKSTSIEWGDHDSTDTSATFTSYPDSIIAKGITFKNTYHALVRPGVVNLAQALAARVNGDKCAFYDCGFVGFQDTFWDEMGRHYFSQCYFEGAIDFIFGKAQSIYEKCEISINIEKFMPGLAGYITAQKKECPKENSGFIFKNCVFNGVGKTYFGRAWGPYSTVIIYNSTISINIVPEGWFAWNNAGHEANFMYVEANNRGPGADTSRRVPWLKKLDSSQLQGFLSLSFIEGDGDRWLNKLPDFF